MIFSVDQIRADEHNLDPRIFQNVHNSQYGHFSHSSAIFARESWIEAEYAVCNLDDDTELIYTWDGPNITIGPGGRLPVDKCHILNRSLAAVDHDTGATISFTQASRLHSAYAHVSKLPINTAILPRFLEHRLRTLFGPERSATEPSLGDLHVVEVNNQGSIRHIISWHPPRVTVAIPEDSFAGQRPEAVERAVEAAGYEADVFPLEKAIANPEPPSSLSASRLAANVILLRKSAESPPVLDFTLETGEQRLAMEHSHITLIDSEDLSLIADVEVGRFAPLR